MKKESGIRIGIDLGGTKIEAIALDAGGREVLRKREPTPRHDYAATLGVIATLVGDFEHRLNRRATVGVGIPGAISLASGRVKNANSTCLIGQTFDQDLARILERPVRIANDANCFALSEALDGAGQGRQTVFGAILGTGTGGGLVFDRQIITGRNRISGEWGHNPLPWPRDDERPGPDCYCGKRGCVETFVSGPGLARDWPGTSAEAPESAEAVVTAAESGDATALAALGRYEDRLARALAHVINIFDPDVVVLGGGLSKLTRLYGNLPSILPRYVFSDRVDTEILAPKHGDSSGVRGAAWLWPRAAARG